MYAIRGKAKRVWNLLGHSSIFLLIAGTYTPVILAGMRTTRGWVLFGIVWSLAVIGLVMKAVARERVWSSAPCSMPYGVVDRGRVPGARHPPTAGQRAAPLFRGGLAYTIGILFFA